MKFCNGCGQFFNARRTIKMLRLTGIDPELLQATPRGDVTADLRGVVVVKLSSPISVRMTAAFLGAVLLVVPCRGADQTAKAPDAAVQRPVESSEPSASPVPCARRLREGDEFWQLSTRHLWGCASSDLAESIAAHEYVIADKQMNWQKRSLDEFFRNDGKLATVFCVHGNRRSADDAVARGWMMYDALELSDTVPVRFVLWSWPSDRVRGLRRDISSKAARTEDDAYYFGWVLRHLHSPSRVGIAGYSFGARIVTGGLHLAAGGQLDGRSIEAPDPVPTPHSYGVVLAAGAEHNHWILPNSVHGQALENVDHFFNIYNSCDPILARYRFIDRREKPVALGFAGISPSSLGAFASRVEQRDAAPSIGRTHDSHAYLFDATTPAELRRYLLPPPPPSASK